MMDELTTAFSRQPSLLNLYLNVSVLPVVPRAWNVNMFPSDIKSGCENLSNSYYRGISWCPHRRLCSTKSHFAQNTSVKGDFLLVWSDCTLERSPSASLEHLVINSPGLHLWAKVSAVWLPADVFGFQRPLFKFPLHVSQIVPHSKVFTAVQCADHLCSSSLVFVAQIEWMSHLTPPRWRHYEEPLLTLQVDVLVVLSLVTQGKQNIRVIRI